MTLRSIRCTAAAIAATLLPASGMAQTPDAEFFEKKIRPVFARGCQGCHNGKVKSAGLDLSSGEGFLKGGQSGPLIAADASQSRLLRVISYDESMKMPPTGKLKPEELRDIAQWVQLGAVWPGAAAVAAPAVSEAKQWSAEQKSFWSFQPVKAVAPPSVRDTKWARTPIDRFVLANLEEKGLKPAAPAGKLTLLRRATYDLTGLPPTIPEMRDFLADDSAQSFSKVIDRLLESPRYGERWGRHWLDVARYADSTGNDEDHRYPYAYRYRDYVIDAFNADMPFNQFVKEQIAGDLMPAADGSGINKRGIIATGFLALGAKAIAQQDKKKMLYDVWDEQVDVTSKALLGLTLACARCHDHKFDPLYTKDYYSMVGMFASTRSFKDPDTHVSKLLYTPLVPKKEYEVYQAYRDKQARNKIEREDVADEEAARYNKELLPRLGEYMLAARFVYEGGAKSADVARERNLNAAVADKWVKYLKPRPGVIRLHFDKWDQAPKSEWQALAKGYQEGYEKSLVAWNQTLAKWRNQSRRMLKEMNMPPPEKPKVDAEKEPFFAEVSTGQGPFAISNRDRDKIFSADAKARLAALKAEGDALSKNAPPEPEMACAVEEGEVVNQKVLIRGDYNSLGSDAPKSFPVILAKAGDPKVARGSGRMELAEWLTRPDHPLVPRVIANRIWHWHFGEGIVRTPDNFGKMGERPANPELLDYLAGRFVAEGWSFKKMHREIMLSSAYQMSSEIADAAYEKDPENKLFSRFQRRRLAVEELHDSLLAMDGSLDLKMGGTLQTGFGTDGENSAGRLSISPEKSARRTVYIPLRRANLPALLNLFDFGDATTVTGKRNASNVAPQALFSMNSEFVSEHARMMAQSLLADASMNAPKKLEQAFLLTLNRRPAAGETDSGLTYIGRYHEKFSNTTELDAWQSFVKILLSSNDFMYVD